MTNSEKKDIPAQTNAGAAGQPDQPLSDGNLEQVTGGMPADLVPTTDDDDDDPGVDLDMVEGSIRLKPGSDVPFVDK